MMEGFLGERHLVSLGIYFAFALLLYLFLRKRSVRVRRTVLGILSFAGLPALVWYPLACGDLLRFLPLELCSFTALLLPAAVLTGDRKLNNVLLLWSFGSFCAILLNPLETAWSPGDTEFWMFYAPHAAEAAVPPLMFALGLAEKDPRCIPVSVGSTFAAYTFSHACNRLINAFYARTGSPCRVNYMFAERPENPVLDACWRLVPVPYLYALVLLPGVVLLLLLLYIPQIAGKKRKNG